MIEERAHKIAATLIRQFSKDKHFSISLPKTEDLEILADIFRDTYGCTVVWSYARHKIGVYVPQPQAVEEPVVQVREAVTHLIPTGTSSSK
jgi:hypothetical protein